MDDGKPGALEFAWEHYQNDFLRQRYKEPFDDPEIQFSREEDGRWIAEWRTCAGALCYGETKDQAARRVKALVLRIAADRVENGDEFPRGIFL